MISLFLNLFVSSPETVDPPTGLAFERRDLEAYADSLAAYLPNDRLYEGKRVSSSNLRKLILGLSHTLFNTNGYIKGFTDDVSPLVTEKFIGEWERAVGIPDDCYSVEGETISQRRLQVIAKLSYMACQTTDDFVDLASWFGFVITVTPGIEDVSGATSGLTDTEKRFTIVVNTLLSDDNAFPLEFPILFGATSVSFLTCIIEKIIPSNCQVLFNNQG